MKKIFITGASRGIGAFLLKSFRSNGDYKVFGTYSSTQPTELMDVYTKVDVTDNDVVQNWITNNASVHDEIILINCAGMNYNVLARKANLDKWRNIIDVNIVGTFNVISKVLPLMYEKKYGRIINLSSVVAQSGMAGTSAYAASKAALWGMTKSIAKENAEHGITINNLNLGYFSLGMTISDVPEKYHANILQNIPCHEFGNPNNILNAINYLIDSPYTNGTSIDINGGIY